MWQAELRCALLSYRSSNHFVDFFSAFASANFELFDTSGQKVQDKTLATKLRVLACPPLEYVVFMLSSLPNLEQLTFSDCSDCNRTYMYDLLSKLWNTALPKLQKLEFSRSPMELHGMSALALACANGALGNLTVLVLNNSITDDDFEYFANTCAKSLPLLSHLEVKSNGIDSGVFAFADVLQQQPALQNLKVLHLLDNRISDKGFEALFPILHRLTTFSIGSNVSYQGIMQFSTYMTKTRLNLTSLNLQRNRFIENGILEFLSACCTHGALPNLTMLNLCNTKFRDNAMESLSGYWCRTALLRNLTELWLDHNLIGNTGISALADACKETPLKLTTLSLKSNDIEDAGVEAFAKACALDGAPFAQLTVLHLLKNDITDAGFATLFPLLENGGKLSGLTQFSIGSDVTDEGMQQFAELITKRPQSLPQLTLLNLGHNDKIGDDGFSAFADAVANKALAALQQIWVDNRHPQLVAACQPRGIAIN